jgi:hypothetical protein
VAEEGEARDTPAFSEVERVSKLKLDANAFPSGAELAKPEQLGRLEVSRLACDTDGDGDADRLVAFGGRGVSVWRVGQDGKGASLVWDSGSAVESTVAQRMPSAANASNDQSPSRDARSKSRGPEPKGLALTQLGGRRLLMAGLERPGGVVVWDVTNPSSPTLLDYVNRRDATIDDIAKAGDLGHEGVLAIPASISPDGTPLLVVCNEVSGTTTIWRIVAGPAPDSNARRGL